MGPEVRHLLKQMPRGRETQTAQKVLLSCAWHQGSDQCLLGHHAFQTDGKSYEPRVYGESPQLACETEGPAPENLKPLSCKSHLFTVT